MASPVEPAGPIRERRLSVSIHGKGEIRASGWWGTFGGVRHLSTGDGFRQVIGLRNRLRFRHRTSAWLVLQCPLHILSAQENLPFDLRPVRYHVELGRLINTGTE